MKRLGKILLLAGAMMGAIHAGAGFGADADPRAEDRKLPRVLMAEAEAGINAQSAVWSITQPAAGCWPGSC